MTSKEMKNFLSFINSCSYSDTQAWIFENRTGNIRAGRTDCRSSPIPCFYFAHDCRNRPFCSPAFIHNFFRNFSRYVLRFSADLHKDEPEIPDSFAIIVPFPGNCNRGSRPTQQIFKTVLAIILPHQYNILLWVKSLLPRLTTINPQKK